MTTIALLIETGATPSSVSATLDLFRIAERLSGEPFPIHIFSAQGGAVALAPGLALDSIVAATPSGGTVLCVATYTALMKLRRGLVDRSLLHDHPR